MYCNLLHVGNGHQDSAGFGVNCMTITALTLQVYTRLKDIDYRFVRSIQWNLKAAMLTSSSPMASKRIKDSKVQKANHLSKLHSCSLLSLSTSIIQFISPCYDCTD